MTRPAQTQQADQASPTIVQRLRARHASAPIASVVTIYLVLATVRLAGAFAVPLMVLSVGLSILVLAILPRDRWPAEAGLQRFRARPALFGVALTICTYAMTVGATRVAFGRGRDNWAALEPDLFRSLAPGLPWLYVLVMVASMAVLVPVVEEVCYRGVLFGAVEQRYGASIAVLTTSAGWALVHLGDYGMKPFNANVIAGMLPSVFLMGVALGVCRVLTGSAVASIIAQGIANLLLVAWVSWFL